MAPSPNALAPQTVRSAPLVNTFQYKCLEHLLQKLVASLHDKVMSAQIVVRDVGAMLWVPGVRAML